MPDQPHGRDEVRAAVIGTASRLFAERGPSQVSTRDIAEAAGVNRGLLHRHFGSKEALVTAVVEEGAHELSRRLEGVGDITGIVDTLFEVGESTRDTSELLARALVDGMDLDLSGEHFGVLERLTTALGGDDHRFEAAVMLATLLGWQLFSDSLLSAQGLQPDPVRGRAALKAIGEALAQVQSEPPSRR